MTPLEPPASPGAPPDGEAVPAHTCWVCGSPMREVKCKIICPHCGYTRDCSDP